jgi:hypothetical protein
MRCFLCGPCQGCITRTSSRQTVVSQECVNYQISNSFIAVVLVWISSTTPKYNSSHRRCQVGGSLKNVVFERDGSCMLTQCETLVGRACLVQWEILKINSGPSGCKEGKGSYASFYSSSGARDFAASIALAYRLSTGYDLCVSHLGVCSGCSLLEIAAPT